MGGTCRARGGNEKSVHSVSCNTSREWATGDA
jgi:hypothetical protein